jgi:hypothetical protein
MQLDQDTEGDADDYGKNLFQIKKNVRSVVSQQYNIFQCHPIGMQTKSFFDAENSHELVGAMGTVDSFKGVFREDRFSKKPHKDVIFVVCQFFLWSRTDKKAQSELNQLFSSLHPTQ